MLRGKRRRNVIALTWTRLLFLSLSAGRQAASRAPQPASLRAHIDENRGDVAEPDERINHKAALDDVFESARAHDETEPTEPMPPSEGARLTLG